MPIEFISRLSQPTKKVAVILLGMLAIILHIRLIMEGLPNYGSDFEQDHVAAVALRAGQPIYDFIRHSDKFHIFHPPLVALVFFPLSFLTLDQAYIIFCLISVFLLTGALLQVCKNNQVEIHNAWLATLLGLSWWPTLFSTKVGALSTLIASLLLYGWILAKKNHPYYAGFLFALAAGLKIFPGIILLVFAIKRQKQLFIGCLASLILLYAATALLSTPSTIVDFLTVVRFYVDTQTSCILNISILGLCNRAADVLKLTEIMPLANIHLLTSRIALSISLLIFAFFIYYIGKKKVDTNLSLGLACCLMILISPASWSHTMLMLTLPLYADFHRLSAKSYLFLTSLFAISLPDLLFAQHLASAYNISPPWPPMISLMLSLPAIGVLIFSYLIIRVGSIKH